MEASKDRSNKVYKSSQCPCHQTLASTSTLFAGIIKSYKSEDIPYSSYSCDNDFMNFISNQVLSAFNLKTEHISRIAETELRCTNQYNKQSSSKIRSVIAHHLDKFRNYQAFSEDFSWIWVKIVSVTKWMRLIITQVPWRLLLMFNDYWTAKHSTGVNLSSSTATVIMFLSLKELNQAAWMKMQHLFNLRSLQWSRTRQVLQTENRETKKMQWVWKLHRSKWVNQIQKSWDRSKQTSSELSWFKKIDWKRILIGSNWCILYMIPLQLLVIDRIIAEIHA